MRFPNLLDYRDYADLLDSLLPDFVLAFAFFTSIIYAVLGRRFSYQRPAVATAAASGAALAIGLVCWEQSNDLSIRNLGPIAVGFAVILLGGVIYQSICGVGGSWSGAGIAVGACLLVGWSLGIDWPVDMEVIQTITTVTLTVGVLAFLLHRRGIVEHVTRSPRELDSLRHDMRDLYEDRGIADRLFRGFRDMHRKADTLHEHPEDGRTKRSIAGNSTHDSP